MIQTSVASFVVLVLIRLNFG
jgi:hypothetical protein